VTPALDGSFVEDLEYGRYEVTFENVGGASTPAQIVDTLLVPATGPVIIEPRDGVEVSGRLLDASGAPLARATLSLVSEQAGAWTETVTDEGGGFSRYLLPGTYAASARVDKAMYRLDPVQLAGSEEAVLRLPKGERVAGQVRHPRGDDVLLAVVEEPLSLFDLDTPPRAAHGRRSGPAGRQ
jgi:hypothetical protein